jgi:hypothetical protein
MKSLTLLFLLFFMTTGLLAAQKSTENFVIIGDETYYCDEVHAGMAKTSIYIDGKLRFKVPSYVISAYAQSGKFFEYLPVLNKNQDTTGWAFMQFITSHDGNRLYRYCSNCLKYDPVNATVAPIVPVYRYYVFRSGKFVSVSDDQDLQSQLAVFGVKVTI